jgi:hypothetical protein
MSALTDFGDFAVLLLLSASDRGRALIPGLALTIRAPAPKRGPFSPVAPELIARLTGTGGPMVRIPPPPAASLIVAIWMSEGLSNPPFVLTAAL